MAMVRKALLYPKVPLISWLIKHSKQLGCLLISCNSIYCFVIPSLEEEGRMNFFDPQVSFGP